jgi:flagellar basal body rod protein FlgC
MDPLSTARYGLMAAQSQLQTSASRVANMGSDPSVDPVQETVNQVEAKQQFAANAQVIKIADEMWRSLLEVQVR